jgi:gentisate 1,2-dioxygenase
MAETMNASDGEARQALKADLKELHFAIHQPDDPPLFTSTPRPGMLPAHYKASDIKSFLERIGREIKLEAGGVRRTLRLSNPGQYWTAPTFGASIQYILPGEVATAHRHTASALRFIMEGEGADTIVDGEKYQMNEGDLVFTPGWSWHDHAHNGDKPMIWLDVLDIPLVRSLEAVFFEGSETPRQTVNAQPDASFREFGSGIMRPSKPQHIQFANPLLAYPRARAEEALMLAAGLDPDPFDDTIMEYVNPLDGGPAAKTIGTMLQRLRPGIKLKSHRHTGNVLYYVVRGNGSTAVNEERFDWVTGDFFSVPSWALHNHENRSQSDDCILFQVNDFPTMKALGLWREQSAD